MNITLRIFDFLKRFVQENKMFVHAKKKKCFSKCDMILTRKKWQSPLSSQAILVICIQIPIKQEKPNLTQQCFLIWFMLPHISI